MISTRRQRIQTIMTVGLYIFAAVVLVLQLQRRVDSRKVYTPIDDAMSYIESGILRVVRTSSSFLDKYSRGLAHFDNSVSLYDRVHELELHQFETEVMRHDLDLMKELVLTIDRVGRQRTIGAKVIGRIGLPRAESIRIDRGYRDGVSVGQGVLADFGVCGRVSRVSRSSALVTLLSDPTSAIDVMTQASRARGVLSVGSSGDELEVRDFDRLADIRPGDRLITSGLTRGFPLGIPVGTINEVMMDADGLYQQAKVRSMGNVATLERVIVLVELEEHNVPSIGAGSLDPWTSMVTDERDQR